MGNHEAATRAHLLVAASVIPHKLQRYETTGDWKFDDDLNPALLVRVSDMNNRDYEFLVAIHEAVEAWLCRKAGIKEVDVSLFDAFYEEARRNGETLRCGCKPTETSEPGDDPHAPYFHQHQFATSIERQLASRLGVDWSAYEAANLALYDEPK